MYFQYIGMVTNATDRERESSYNMCDSGLHLVQSLLMQLRERIVITYDYGLHTLDLLLMLQGDCTVLRFPLCDLWEMTMVLMELSVCSYSDPLQK